MESNRIWRQIYFISVLFFMCNLSLLVCRKNKVYEIHPIMVVAAVGLLILNNIHFAYEEKQKKNMKSFIFIHLVYTPSWELVRFDDVDCLCVFVLWSLSRRYHWNVYLCIIMVG